MLQLRHLAYFVAVVDAGSLSRAAQIIHVAQPSLSQQIAALEAGIGEPLLLRSARGVRPTPAGEILYREAVAVLRQVEAIPDRVRHPERELTGSVTLGISTTISSEFGADILDACSRSLPDVRITFRSADSLTVAAAIENREFDLGVVFEADPMPRLLRRELYRQRLYLFGASAETLARAATHGLDSVPLVLPSAPNVLRIALERVMAERGIVLTADGEAATYSDMVMGLSIGNRVTLLPKGELDSLTAGLARPLPLEPKVTLTAVIVSSDEFPLSAPAAAVGAIAEQTIASRVIGGSLRGAEAVRPGQP